MCVKLPNKTHPPSSTMRRRSCKDCSGRYFGAGAGAFAAGATVELAAGSVAVALVGLGAAVAAVELVVLTLRELK